MFKCVSEAIEYHYKTTNLDIDVTYNAATTFF